VDELLTQVWAGVVVTPDSVYQAVASLRRMLGDDARQPAYIATVPRLGYRLVAPVSVWADQVFAADVEGASADAQVTSSGVRADVSPPAPQRRVAILLGAG